MGRGAEDLASLSNDSRKKPLPADASRGFLIPCRFLRSLSIYFNCSAVGITFTKMIKNVNRTSDSMKASPTKRAI